MNEYQDLSEVRQVADDLRAESADHSNFPILEPGVYENPSRTITAKLKDNGNITFKIVLDGGLWRDGRKFLASEITYVSTTQFSREGYPGTTSTAAEYLRKVGIDPKGGSVVDLMAESQTIPVGVFIGRTNKTRKLDDGSYEQEFLKTRDFNTGTKDNPNWVTQIERDGVTFTAKHKVQSFQKLVA